MGYILNLQLTLLHYCVNNAPSLAVKSIKPLRIVCVDWLTNGFDHERMQGVALFLPAYVRVKGSENCLGSDLRWLWQNSPFKSALF